ncbi:hypothetical protein BGZ99_000064 [Dissophora globulifera]|uniref:Sister chromatid cohesion protein DCC1 n=1 Tax=Dissophora globulifera TaxID=979702 RepID=A0A9P6V0G2_9FUNG|nr:hypothetical protein BGZ99_000064 [Dissophora globulifera]
MANPSTQAPSNATTTNIIFARDFVQSTYTLIEIPKSLQSYIDNNEENALLSFQVRGLEKDTAVLCTPTQTFSLQRAHTSNMLVPIAPIIKQSTRYRELDDMDTDVDTYEHPDDDADSPYEKQMVLDILDSVLDLIPTTPRLERLAEVLGPSAFEGWDRESEAKGHLYSWARLQSVIQASDKEILQWLKEQHACLIEGNWRLFKRRFMYDILQEILMTINVLEMPADSVDGESVCKMIEEEAPERESGIEPWMVKHCLTSFADDEKTSEPGRYHLSPGKICAFMGIHLLSTVERGNRWRLEEFMQIWEKSLHGHFQTDLSYLAGECIVESDRVPEKKQTQQFIRYFSKSNLSTEPAARFTALFEIKSKWEGPEIRPFLRDLVLDEKKLDILLLKHARSVKQPGGGIIYSSRVIK